jgi:hypothetical protein
MEALLHPEIIALLLLTLLVLFGYSRIRGL